MTDLAVVGLGATGSQVARQLLVGHDGQLFVFDADIDRRALVMGSLDSSSTRVGNANGASADVVVLATPAGDHASLARRVLDRGANVVSLSDSPADVGALLELDGDARERELSVAVGAGFAPGLSCLLARHASNVLDSVDVVAVAKTGTGGPACAREHHRALQSPGIEMVGGEQIHRTGGSGRELAWFPDPIGARDCYRGDLPSPMLLRRAFPDTGRLTARMSATRRDRLTSRLPMLRPPHADGGPGAIRVEVRGRVDGRVETLVYGVMDRPSAAAGMVGAVIANEMAMKRLPIGAFGLAELGDPVPILRQLHQRGLRAATYEGDGLI